MSGRICPGGMSHTRLDASDVDARYCGRAGCAFDACVCGLVNKQLMPSGQSVPACEGRWMTSGVQR